MWRESRSAGRPTFRFRFQEVVCICIFSSCCFAREATAGRCIRDYRCARPSKRPIPSQILFHMLSASRPVYSPGITRYSCSGIRRRPAICDFTRARSVGFAPGLVPRLASWSHHGAARSAVCARNCGSLRCHGRERPGRVGFRQRSVLCLCARGWSPHLAPSH